LPVAVGRWGEGGNPIFADFDAKIGTLPANGHPNTNPNRFVPS